MQHVHNMHAQALALLLAVHETHGAAGIGHGHVQYVPQLYFTCTEHTLWLHGICWLACRRTRWGSRLSWTSLCTAEASWQLATQTICSTRWVVQWQLYGYITQRSHTVSYRTCPMQRWQLLAMGCTAQLVEMSVLNEPKQKSQQQPFSLATASGSSLPWPARARL